LRVYVATTNAGKLRELRQLLEPHGWTVESYQAYDAPAEGDLSYEGNAVLKARALAGQLAAAELAYDAVLGDDSGIEAEAIGWRPGVLSARYGGDISWEERRALLIREVGAGPRAARFVCVVHLIRGDGRTWTAEGTVGGEIAPREAGDGGFSYDAVFFYPPAAKTFAQMTEEEKNAASHRGLAMSRLLKAVSPA
jgi:XTP/dITP diphosphohydrolase